MHKTLCIVFLFLLAAPAFAAEGGMKPPSWAPAVPAAEQGNTAAAQAGFGMVSEDYYLKLNLGLDLNLGKVGVGIAAPLNILAYDKDPDSRDKAYGGLLRKEDWDEVSDYGKILRYVRYGHKREPFYLLAGELSSVTVGHGTLMNRYYNALDIDHYKAGLVVDVNTRYGGVETVVNSFLAKPTLFGGRLYLKPLVLLMGGKNGGEEEEGESTIADNFSIGATYLRDVTAPLTLSTTLHPNQTPSQTLDLDDKGNPKVKDSDDFKATGVDVEYVLVDTGTFHIVPYTDLNHLSRAGTGLHIGTLADFYFPIGIDFNISSKVEYRLLGSHYIPSYFDGFYEMQRFMYIGDDPSGSLKDLEDDPKLNYTRNRLDDTRHGYYGELALGFAGFLETGAAYEDYQGENNSKLSVFARVPALDIVKVEAYYFKNNFEKFDEVTEFDERSLFMAQVKFRMAPGLYLVGVFYRQWQLDAAKGEYKPVDNWSVGAAYEMTF